LSEDGNSDCNTTGREDLAMDLLDKIRRKDAHLGVIGLGYVGLPLAVEFAKAGFRVTGIDVNEERVARLRDGISYIKDVSSDEVAPLVRSSAIRPSTDFSLLREVDTVDICVPTPLRKTRDPDVSFIVAAVEKIRETLHPVQLIVLESTTYPGTTEELILPMLEETGLKVGTDFHLAFSPERVDPGNPRYNTRNIPKVVGGVTPKCTEAACTLYSQTLETVVEVTSTQVAEMVKLLENTFRSVNIGLVNELALMCRKMGIDVWEVIRAASTKPFGFMPFYPGPGLGGHCIPIDPFYLSWKARAAGFEARFIELAGAVNSNMPYHVASIVAEALNAREKAVRGSRILILGVAYKENIDDLRESPALDVMSILSKQGAELLYHDPHVPRIEIDHGSMESVPLDQTTLKKTDCAVVITAHASIDYRKVLAGVPLLVDTRNCLAGVSDPKLFRL
jgi:UDP-N-acetyl-D-glucosamine dehydrogenase